MALIGVPWPGQADTPRFHRTAAGGGETHSVSAASVSAMAEWEQCLAAAGAAGRDAGIPVHLLDAMAVVESGRRDTQGRVVPWPWSFNVEGIDHVFDSKAEAIAAVTDLQAHGVRSIDIGCLQVNLFYHPDAFATLDAAFDPAVNARYAAAFLMRLYVQTGSWGAATAAYHSATPDLGRTYVASVSEVFASRWRGAGGDPAAMQFLHFASTSNGSGWNAAAWDAMGWTRRTTARTAANRHRVLETERSGRVSAALEGALAQFAEHRTLATTALSDVSSSAPFRLR